jgi:hypothetical protein
MHGHNEEVIGLATEWRREHFPLMHAASDSLRTSASPAWLGPLLSPARSVRGPRRGGCCCAGSGYGSSRASAMPPAARWPRCTAGSPRALTPPTCRR